MCPGRNDAADSFGEEQATAALWYKDAVIYELHVRAFFDSNGDGIGDFRGLTRSSITCRIWASRHVAAAVLSIAAAGRWLRHRRLHDSSSRLRHARRFQEVLREAHGAACRSSPSWCSITPRISTPGFSGRAARAGRPRADFYVWSDTSGKYLDARIIFKDFEQSNWSWDPVAQALLLAPVLLSSARLELRQSGGSQENAECVDFWLEIGVDGLRLDAVPYSIEREGTNCENLPETHAFLSSSDGMSTNDIPNRMLLAEANQWPEDAVAISATATNATWRSTSH